MLADGRLRPADRNPLHALRPQKRARWGRTPEERTLQQRNHLIEDHLYLVRPVVSRVRGRWALSPSEEIGDLESAAMLGLIRAAETWDPRVSRFVTLAWHDMVGAIRHERRSASNVPAWLYEVTGQVRKAEDRLFAQGAAPTDQAVAEELGEILVSGRARRVTADMIADWRAWNPVVRSLDAAHEESGEAECGDRCGALVDWSQSVDREAAVVVRQSVASLRPRQREIVRLVYWEGLSVSDVARLWGLTRSTASHVHTVALHRLHNRLATTFGEKAELACAHTHHFGRTAALPARQSATGRPETSLFAA